MALEQDHIISQKALEAPLRLAENADLLYASLMKVVDVSHKINTNLSSGSPSKMAKETQQLTGAQVELEKIQKQILVAQAKQNDEVIQSTKALQKERDAIKQKTALGDRDAKTVRAQTASIEQLGAALTANRKAYSQLRTEEERNSKTGQELIKIITEQDAEYKNLKVSMGQSQDKVGDYEGALKGLKDELKAARNEMVGIAKTLGTESPEFLAAATKAGKLKDELNDIQDAVKNTEASGLENIATSFGNIGDKLKSGDFGGAASSAQQFATALNGMSVKELSSQIGSFGSAIASVGRALLTNPIFLLAAAVTAAVVAIQYFSAEGEKASQRLIERSKREMDALSERYDHEIRLMEIAGKKTFEKEKEKQQEIIKSADEAMKNSGDVTKFDLFQSVLQRRYVRTVNEEKLQSLNEFSKAKKDAQKELEIINAQEAADEIKTQQEVTTKFKEELEKRFQLQIEHDIKIGELRNQEDAARKEELDKAIENIQTAATFEEEISALIAENQETFTDRYLSLSDIRRQKFEEEMAFTQDVINDAQMAIQASLLSNENFIKSLAKNSLVFFLSQVEKRMLAVQAETILAATQRSLASPDSVATFGASGIARSLAISALIKTAFGVAKAQISRFEDGTMSAPGGLAFVGEAGAELVKTPSGKFSLTPDSATLVNLPRGSRVYTHEDTMQMLAMSGIGASEVRGNQSELASIAAIIDKSNKRSADKIVGAVKQTGGTFHRKGSLLYETIEDENRNRKHIRRSVING
jgi:hypothetical protein